MTDLNKIDSALIEVKVLTLLASDTASLSERQQEHAAVFSELAKLQTASSPEEFVQLFIGSPAFSNDNICTQITVKGERFLSTPTRYSNHSGVRFTTSFELLKPTEDYDEQILVQLREKTVPAGWTVVSEPLKFVLQKQFMPVEDLEEEVVSFNLFVRSSGPGDMEVMVAGETSGFIRHAVGRIRNQLVAPNEHNVYFWPDKESLEKVYVVDPYVAMVVRYLAAHTATLQWIIEILNQVKSET